MTGGRESPVRNIGFGLRDEVVWAEVLVRPACDVSETTNKCFMAQNLWLTCFNQVVWTVLRGFVEELDLLEPECEIDLRNARLSNILHACGPVHVFVVVFPCRLSRAVHVGETIRESGIARPGCVRVRAREGISMIDLRDVPLAVRFATHHCIGRERLTKLLIDPTIERLTSQISSGMV